MIKCVCCGQVIRGPEKSDEVTVLEYLNKRAGTKFRPVEANLKLIRARFKEGALGVDFIAVIDYKIQEWEGTTMEKYLRPATLFNATNFNQYLGQVDKPIDKGRPDWATLPRSDDQLWDFARKHGFSGPGSLTYQQYRRKLEREIEIRLNQ